MTIEPLGSLESDPHIAGWLRSAPIAVPYFGGLHLPFVLRGVEFDSARSDFESALHAVLHLGPVEREEAGHYVFRLYRQFVAAIGEDEFYFTIPSALPFGISLPRLRFMFLGVLVGTIRSTSKFLRSAVGRLSTVLWLFTETGQP